MRTDPRATVLGVCPAKQGYSLTCVRTGSSWIPLSSTHLSSCLCPSLVSLSPVSESKSVVDFAIFDDMSACLPVCASVTACRILKLSIFFLLLLLPLSVSLSAHTLHTIYLLFKRGVRSSFRLFAHLLLLSSAAPTGMGIKMKKRSLPCKPAWVSILQPASSCYTHTLHSTADRDTSLEEEEKKLDDIFLCPMSSFCCFYYIVRSWVARDVWQLSSD